MFRIVRFSTSLMAACLLLACGYFDDDPPYPLIDKEKLIGCWVAANPSSIGFQCDERCFSSNGFYYSRANSTGAAVGGSGFVESGGTYSVNGNTITRNVKIGNNREPEDTTTISGKDGYTLIRDTLFSIATENSKFNPFVRADSSNTCGPHWQIFPIPEGWDLN